MERFPDAPSVAGCSNGHSHLSDVLSSCTSSAIFTFTSAHSIGYGFQEVSRSNQQHIQNACSRTDLGTFDLWVIVGEWTPAATDCAKYLNGRGVGARYDGSYPGSSRVGSCNGLTGSASTFSSDYKTFLRQYWEAQVCSASRQSTVPLVTSLIAISSRHPYFRPAPTRRLQVGSNGLGRLRSQMSGLTRLVSRTDGSHRTQLNASSPIFVGRLLQLRFFPCLPGLPYCSSCPVLVTHPFEPRHPSSFLPLAIPLFRILVFITILLDLFNHILLDSYLASIPSLPLSISCIRNMYIMHTRLYPSMFNFFMFNREPH